MAHQQRGEETRSRILEAAEACFAEKGYDATGLSEICRRADVSKGAFYHHFPSKESAFFELLNQWLDEIDAGLTEIREMAGSAPEALIHIARMGPAILQQAQTRTSIFLEFWGWASREPQVRAAILSRYALYEDYFARVIEAGITEGTLRPMDAKRAARFFLSMGIGMILQAVLREEKTDEAFMQENMEMVLRGWEKR